MEKKKPHPEMLRKTAKALHTAHWVVVVSKSHSNLLKNQSISLALFKLSATGKLEAPEVSVQEVIIILDAVGFCRCGR